MRSFWLCRKPKRKRALRHRIERPEDTPPGVKFEVYEPETDREVHAGTVTRAKATCLCCGAVLPAERVRARLATQQGGADVIFDAKGNRTGGARLTAVVTLRPGETGRHYRLPNEADYAAVHRAQTRVAQIIEKWEHGGRQGPCPVPDEVISLNEIRRISVPIYGMKTWGDLFTSRQKAALLELGRLIAGNEEHRTRNALGLACSKLSELSCSVCAWEPFAECPRHAFDAKHFQLRGILARECQFPNQAAALRCRQGMLHPEWHLSAMLLGRPLLSRTTRRTSASRRSRGHLVHRPALLRRCTVRASSRFLLCLAQASTSGASLAQTSLDANASTTPKKREIVVDRPHRLSTSTKDAEFYETGMAKAFAEGRRMLNENGIGSVVFAHKTTEGWEALLSGMIRGGWTITGSWPVATEMGSRLNARETASLATSVHLICRPRPDDALIGDWADVLRELPRRVSDWMERLQGEGIRGADLVFACVGPALEIFSRYRSVETAEGREVGLPEYLEKVWEVVGRTALENVLGTAEAKARNGAMGALEEDARPDRALSLDPPEHRDHRRERQVEREGRRDGRQIRGAWVQPSLRRGAPLRPAHGHRPRPLDRPHHRPGERCRATASRHKPRRSTVWARRAQAAADWIESDPAASLQQTLFPETEAPSKPVKRRHGKKSIIDENAELQSLEATALDRVHASMLLQSSGHSNALRKLIVAEQERGPEFLRLANALSALYPSGSDEKRLLDGMLLAVHGDGEGTSVQDGQVARG